MEHLGDDDLLDLAEAASDTLAPGWRYRLAPDAIEDLDARPAHLAPGAELYRLALDAFIRGDDGEAWRLVHLADQTIDAAPRVPASPALGFAVALDDLGPSWTKGKDQPLAPVPPIGPGDCLALAAWTRRGDSTRRDALWRAACWEQQAVQLSRAGQRQAAHDALTRAARIISDAADAARGQAA